MFTLVVDHQRGANFVQMNIYVINSVQYDENSIETRRIVTSVSSWFLAALAALYLTLVSDWLGNRHFRTLTHRVTFDT